MSRVRNRILFRKAVLLTVCQFGDKADFYDINSSINGSTLRSRFLFGHVAPIQGCAYLQSADSYQSPVELDSCCGDNKLNWATPTATDHFR